VTSKAGKTGYWKLGVRSVPDCFPALKDKTADEIILDHRAGVGDRRAFVGRLNRQIEIYVGGEIESEELRLGVECCGGRKKPADNRNL
jgi:hypothetical protein